MGMRFESPEMLAALWALPVLAAAAVYALVRGRAALRRFVDEELARDMAPGVSTLRRAVRAFLVIAAVGLAIVALARPQWGEITATEQRTGRDVCFIIDVSRSMLAEDLVPNRLERAKLWLEDVLASARGDRVAIVAFAGEAVVKCPLTHDYGFALMALRDLSPESVTRGGTLIGDAIRRAIAEVFDTKEHSYKDIILITDGEDHESFPVEAAKQAGEAGVRIIAIGIGDESAGKPIPVADPQTGRQSLMKYGGETVLTRLDAKTLREVAAASKDGVYFHVATGTIDLDEVYKRLVRQAEQKEMEATRSVRHEERFQVFVGGALAMLGLACIVRERR